MSRSTSDSHDSPFASVKSLDLLGAFCLLGASLLLVTALLEAGVTFSWKSAPTISLFTLSGILWIAFYFKNIASQDQSRTQSPLYFPGSFLRIEHGWVRSCKISQIRLPTEVKTDLVRQ
jgi:hypothetical protein